MNISWVLADNLVLDPLADLRQMKNIGSMWGSWRTWRACSTDNVICHDSAKAQELVAKDFHKTCNFYISNAAFPAGSVPAGARLYEGSFVDDVVESDEIVALHLAASTSDIVLLLGFNWQQPRETGDKAQDRRNQVYGILVRNAIRDNPQVQWVLVDHIGPVMSEIAKLDNLTQDSMATALSLLNS